MNAPVPHTASSAFLREPRPIPTRVHLQDAKEWRKRKKQAFAAAYAYDEIGYRHIASQIRKCALNLHFDVYSDRGESIFRLRSEFNYFCRQRHCPVCQMIRSSKAFCQFAPLYSAHLERFPRQVPIHLVLTVPNMWGDTLNAELDALKLGIRRLTRCNDFKLRVRSWYRALEVTWNPDRFEFHPHYHLLCMMDEDYFRPDGSPGRLYLDQSEWLRLWRRSMKRSDIKVLWVERLRVFDSRTDDVDPAKILGELTKYLTKPSTFTPYNPRTRHYECDPEVLYYMHHALNGRHLNAKGGHFRGKAAAKLLPTDQHRAAVGPKLIGSNNDENNLFLLAEEVYRWRKRLDGLSGYVLFVPNPEN